MRPPRIVLLSHSEHFLQVDVANSMPAIFGTTATAGMPLPGGWFSLLARMSFNSGPSCERREFHGMQLVPTDLLRTRTPEAPCRPAIIEAKCSTWGQLVA